MHSAEIAPSVAAIGGYSAAIAPFPKDGGYTDDDDIDILGRQPIADHITQLLRSFDAECRNVDYKKGIYIYGSPGCGKTQFVLSLLAQIGYDAIVYDSSDVRNKQVIDHIASHHISNRNVLDMMYQRHKPIAIVMDEIDGMNNGDKVGITALMKLIRQKKTKKQRLEHQTLNPILCIGNYYVDKKIKELRKVCHCFELKRPTDTQIERLLAKSVPALTDAPTMRARVVAYIQGDMRKLAFIERVYQTRPDFLTDPDILASIFRLKSYNDDAKHLTQTLLRAPVPLDQHAVFMNETDRTIVSLLYHENVVDHLWSALPAATARTLYGRMLEHICYADYVDRLTFQYQIWIFNEMSSLIKTFYNQWMVHRTHPEQIGTYRPPVDGGVRFTKILTKYSTEYNNQLFLYQMSQKLDMDRKDVVALFQELRMVISGQRSNPGQAAPAETVSTPPCLAPTDAAVVVEDAAALERRLYAELEVWFEDANISKLDIKRMYKFLDKNAKKEGHHHHHSHEIAAALRENLDDLDGVDELPLVPMLGGDDEDDVDDDTDDET